MALKRCLFALSLLCLLVVPLLSAYASEKVRKAVYHCDFGDAKRFDGMLRNIYNLVNYYTTNNISYDVRVVANGACVQFLLKDRSGTPFADKKIEDSLLKHIEEMMSSLVDGYNIKFEQCDITLKRMKIEKDKLKPFCSITDSGQVRIVELQNEGFAYIKVE